MADIERCKLCGFVAFHIQLSSHFGYKHPNDSYLDNHEVIGNSDKELAQYGVRPNIQYYRDKLAGKRVAVTDYPNTRTRYAR